jgi:hypothetical protein
MAVVIAFQPAPIRWPEPILKSSDLIGRLVNRFLLHLSGHTYEIGLNQLGAQFL